MVEFTSGKLQTVLTAAPPAGQRRTHQTQRSVRHPAEIIQLLRRTTESQDGGWSHFTSESPQEVSLPAHCSRQHAVLMQ